MRNIVVHTIDTNKYSLEELLSSKYLKGSDLSIFDKYKCEEVKKERIASTILKNKFVKEYYVDEKGKPLSNHICFNVSHSKGMVALAMDEHPIGLDIELIRETNDDLKRYISNDEEFAFIKDDKSFFEIWTSKESLSKCIGEGLNKQVKLIPALPLIGKKEYLKKVFISNQKEYNGYVISITIESDEEPFNILVGTSYF